MNVETMFSILATMVANAEFLGNMPTFEGNN